MYVKHTENLYNVIGQVACRWSHGIGLADETLTLTHMHVVVLVFVFHAPHFRSRRHS